MTTSVDIANRALAQIGTRSQITSLVDGSTEALYANLLYVPLRDFLLREGDYPFSAKPIDAITTTPVFQPWIFAYTYPVDALRIRQAFPAAFSALAPVPLQWAIMEPFTGAIRVIYSMTAIDYFLCTVVPPSEDLWDPIFTESYTRLLASALAFALENRIEASQVKLEQALSFAGIANLRDS